MAERRKDRKNRVLRAGESQRKDGTYMYRYTDVTGKRVCVYARTLEDLRVKEQTIQKELNDGIDYAAGKATVIDLVERYVSLKQGARYSTKVLYDYILGILRNEDFGYRQIRETKQSDVQAWVIKLHQDGRSYGTIRSIRSVLRPAFKMAYNEDVIRRNPFDFNLSDVIPNDTKKRAALSEDTREAWMEFIRTDEVYQKYYDEFVVLLGTGLRVSEFCGLTRNDLDFENRRIRVEHQLCRQRDGTYYIGKPKTASGERYIPMTDEVYQSLKNMIANRPKVKVERIVDGYSGFLMLDKNGNPKVAQHIENEIRGAVKRYQKLHPDSTLPPISPHVYRHTFCTELAAAGIEAKSLQYLMGHATISTTLDTYTHINYERAAEQMAQAVSREKSPEKGLA